MALRPVPSLLVIAALAVSAGLKLPGVTSIRTPTADVFPERIESVLRGQNFEVRYSMPDNDLRWIFGTSGACHIGIAEVAPQGWHRALVTQMSAGNHLAYLFEGRVYTEQPVLQTRMSHYISKLEHYFGMTPRVAPVFAIITAPDCTSFPMEDLAALSRT